jgi:two-component system response regulator PhoP
MRALVIEDESNLRALVAKCFTDEGFAVDVAADGENGMYMAEEFPVDIAIVDLGLPGKSGVEIIRRARKIGKKFPILILTARDGWQAKVEALEAGADDYLVKPFQRDELMARARALVRRSGGWAQPQLECGPILVDASAKTVSVHRQNVDITAFEYKVLEYLILNAGKVISKSTLAEHLYAEDNERDSNVIEVFIRRLRSKLDPDSTINPITTLRGAGYRWDLARGPAPVATAVLA